MPVQPWPSQSPRQSRPTAKKSAAADRVSFSSCAPLGRGLPCLSFGHHLGQQCGHHYYPQHHHWIHLSHRGVEPLDCLTHYHLPTDATRCTCCTDTAGAAPPD